MSYCGGRREEEIGGNRTRLMTDRREGKRYAFTTVIRPPLWAYETFRSHRRRLDNKSFEFKHVPPCIRTAITWIKIPRLSGMYGADFEVEWERFGDCYWVLSERGIIGIRSGQ